ncbi:MAG: hypothetical protein ACI9OH_002470 [Oleispira sp.]|jgi:hypothetical protein
MSKLTGHKEITKQAVNELINSNSQHSVIANLHHMALKHSIQARDIFDVIQLGHWANSGQRHHFMRSFDGQSHFHAYIDAINWIKSNALQATNQLSNRIKEFKLKSDNFSTDSMRSGKHAIAGKPPVRSTLNKHKTKTDHVSWLTLAYACHALQDSFSAGHAIREKHFHPMQPGNITGILRYSGIEKIDHSLNDTKWNKNKNKTETIEFSLEGKVAINATKALITMVLETAFEHDSDNKITALNGWSDFQRTWLNAPTLTKERDPAVDLINQHCTSIQLGDMNFKTMNMEEELLAKAILDEHPVQMDVVYDVFYRLDNHYSSDADDVASIYIKLVKDKAGSAVEQALKRHKKLVTLLVSVLDSGYTTGSEKSLIKYLQH